jgi:hypothetical protein
MNATDMPSSDVLDAVLTFLQEEDWMHEKTDTDPITLRMRFESDIAAWSCYARVFVDKREFVFYSVFPIEVPQAYRAPLMEGITRINSGLAQGNFEMDLADGEILFKTSIAVVGDKLTPQLVRNLVYVNLGAMDQYFPALNQILYGLESPKDAIDPEPS